MKTNQFKQLLKVAKRDKRMSGDNDVLGKVDGKMRPITHVEFIIDEMTDKSHIVLVLGDLPDIPNEIMEPEKYVGFFKRNWIRFQVWFVSLVYTKF